MTLRTVRIDENFKEMPKVELLAKEAFPVEEYLEPMTIIEMADKNDIDFWALYDGDMFVGFMVIKKYETMAYLFFLAIDSKQRSSGYGGKALNTIRMLYPKMEHVVDLEKVDETANNNEQRNSRRRFYLRNGYIPTGKFLRYFGVDYEILCFNEQFDFDKFKKLMDSMDIENFAPVYYSH